MKNTNAQNERKLIAELVILNRKEEYLTARLDELTLELNGVKERAKATLSRRKEIIEQLNQMGVVV
jgi:predicted component of type VI protein secretion system